MKNILLRAPLLTNSGYGVHSRQIFEWLYEKKDVNLIVECLNWGSTPWLINPDLEDGLVGKIMSKSRKIDQKFDMSIQVQLPDEWDTSLANFNIGISAFVETDRCNTKWINACNQMNMIIVPSNFTKSVAKRSGILMTPIHVIPEWFNENVIKNNKEDIEILKDERMKFKKPFNFLLISQLTASNPDLDRKNIYNAIKWTLEEFDNYDDVGIVIKTNMGKGSNSDRAVTEKTIKQMLETIQVKNKKNKITLLHGNMSSKEIACLYKHKQIKSIISPTRGEGYGLPLVDAAAAGLPVVATNATGHLDFLCDGDKKLFLPVDYEIKNIPDNKVDDRIFFKGFNWYDPIESSFKKQIKNLYNEHSNYLATAGELATKTISKFSKKEISKKYENLIFGKNND